MATRNIRSICRALLAMGAIWAWMGRTSVEAQYPETIERVERFFGIGWGDGYHACRSSGIRPGADLPPRSYASETNSPLQRLRGCETGRCLGNPGPTVYHAFDAHCDSLGCDAAPSHRHHGGNVIEYGHPVTSTVITSEPVVSPTLEGTQTHDSPMTIMPPERPMLGQPDDGNGSETRSDSSEEKPPNASTQDSLVPPGDPRDAAEELPAPKPDADVLDEDPWLSSPSDINVPPTSELPIPSDDVDSLLDEADLLLDTTFQQPSTRVRKPGISAVQSLFQSWNAQRLPAPQAARRVATRLPSSDQTVPGAGQTGLIIRQPR